MATESVNEPKWTYDAYAQIPDDGKRHEIIDGDHFVNPAPNIYHQQVSRKLQFQLYMAIELAELGVVMNAPCDVQLTDHDIVQPDLIVVCKPRMHIITPSRVKGTPDLLIEILSPSNPDHDLVRKRELYQRSQVPEYWVAFPDEHRILQLKLVDGVYQESNSTESITMHVPPHVEVDLTKVWKLW